MVVELYGTRYRVLYADPVLAAESPFRPCVELEELQTGARYQLCRMPGNTKAQHFRLGLERSSNGQNPFADHEIVLSFFGAVSTAGRAYSPLRIVSSR